jgi:diguanylate cyclase (GGDEF)-like protein
MPDLATPEPAVPRVRPRRFFTPKSLLILCTLVATFGLTEYLAAAFLARQPITIRVPLSVLALLTLTAALITGGALLHFLQQWKRPVARLRQTLDEALEHQAPIDALSASFGGLTPLAPSIQSLLRHLREQQAEITRLNVEMRQRVAQRTDALQRVVGQLRAQATRDVLTALYNRRMLDQSLDDLVQRCAKDAAPLCLLMIDVDDFKLLNDTLGHAAGDSLLRGIGQLIRSSVRQQDLAFRCGGDEFVIVLPQSSRADGDHLAKRLTDLVDALVKPLSVPRKPRLSIGLSTLEDLRESPPTAHALLQDADRNLYATKFARKSQDPRAA